VWRHDSRRDRTADCAAAVIDLHVHLLPGVDDGPADLEGSLALARALADDGVEAVAATPHLRRTPPTAVASELEERTADLARALAAEDVPLRVVQGAEVDLLWAQRAGPAELRAASYGGRGADLLVETPYRELPPTFEDLVFALSVQGYRVTLAHPERSHALKADPDRVGALVERGVLVQLTARSLAARPSATAKLLFERGWAHVLASDAHALDRRPPDLGASVRQAADAFPHARAELEWMVTAAPQAIVDGRPLPERPARERRGRRLRLRLRLP
jgi:protein-tyrosine phosphatase